MKIIPPAADVETSKQSAVQALYNLVMNVAEAASQGQMPDSRPDGLTKLGVEHVVDALVHLVQMAAVAGVCPECAGYQSLADSRDIPIEIAPHP